MEKEKTCLYLDGYKNLGTNLILHFPHHTEKYFN